MSWSNWSRSCSARQARAGGARRRARSRAPLSRRQGRTGDRRHDRQSLGARRGLPGAGQVRGGAHSLRRHSRLAAGRRAGLHARPRAGRIRPRRNGAGGGDARRIESALARLALARRPPSLRQGAGRRGPDKRRSPLTRRSPPIIPAPSRRCGGPNFWRGSAEPTKRARWPTRWRGACGARPRTSAGPRSQWFAVAERLGRR